MMKERGYGINLDFRTKFIMTLVIATVMISGTFTTSYPEVSYIIAAIPFLCLLIDGYYGPALKSFIILLVVIIGNKYLLRYSGGVIGSIFLAITGIGLQMLPGFMMGYYSLISTGMSDLVQSMKRIKIPDVLTIPISVMFRFFNSIREDYRSIKDSMKMRGLTGKDFFKNPGRYFEYRIVPLLMCALNAADDVSVSAMTRGMAVGQERSSISDARLRVQDYVFMVMMFVLLISYIYFTFGDGNV